MVSRVTLRHLRKRTVELMSTLRSRKQNMRLHVWVLSHSVVSDSSATPWTVAPPGSSVQGILQARILEWVAMPSSRGSSRPGDQTHVSYVCCLGRQVCFFFTTSNRLRSSCIQIVKWEMQVCPLSRPGTPCRAGDPRTHSHLWISVRRHPAIILHFVYLP